MLVKVTTKNKEFAPTAQLKLTDKIGNFIKGTLKRRIKDGNYPDKDNYYITASDLEGQTVIWDKTNRVEVDQDVNVGEDVFVKGYSQLGKALADVAEGTYVEITYTGKSNPKKGRKPAYLFDVSVDR